MKKIALVLILTLLAGCTPTPAPVSSNNQDISSADDTVSVSSVESVVDASSETPTTSTVSTVESVVDASSETPTTSTVSTASKAPTTTSKPTSSKPKVDNEPAYAKAGGVIPTGATYTVKATGKVLKAGEKMPSKPADGDKFVYGDYIYYFFIKIEKPSAYIVNDGWRVVRVTDGTKTKYGELCGKINGTPLKFLEDTFMKCDKMIESPAIPNSVEVIAYAYYNAKSITKTPKLPSSLKYLHYGFQGCDSLKTLAPLPNGIMSAVGAYCSCIGLKDLSDFVIPSTCEKAGGMFMGCEKLTAAPKISQGVKEMGAMFQMCTSLKTAPKIPNGVTVMGGCFADCTSLINPPVIPDSVTKMSGTFENCVNLKTAPKIPNNVGLLQAAFSGCTSLTKAPAIPQSAYNIERMFQNCKSLTGDIQVSCNPASYDGFLRGVSNPITISGMSIIKDKLLATQTAE